MVFCIKSMTHSRLAQIANGAPTCRMSLHGFITKGIGPLFAVEAWGIFKALHSVLMTQMVCRIDFVLSF